MSTDDFDPKIRYEAWRENTLGINEVIVDPDRRATFSARVVHWKLGQMELSDKRTPAMRLVRPLSQSSSDGRDGFVLRVTRRGVGASRSGDRSFRAGPGELVIGSFAGGFEDIWTSAEWVTIKLPIDLFPGLPEVFAAIGPGRVRGTGARLLADYLLSLPVRLPGASGQEMPMIAEMTRSMIAHSLLGATAQRLLPSRDLASVARAQVCRVIEQQIGSARLDPRRICDLAGISRSSLYRMFEAEGGVVHFIQRRRLQLVHAALSDPLRMDEQISTLAERYGFYNVSSFNRAFRRAYGMTPGDVRARALSVSHDPAILRSVPG